MIELTWKLPTLQSEWEEQKGQQLLLNYIKEKTGLSQQLLSSLYNGSNTWPQESMIKKLLHFFSNELERTVGLHELFVAEARPERKIPARVYAIRDRIKANGLENETVLLSEVIAADANR
ncbi:MAG: hypothetical protein AAF639_22895 [Chloroflexota bacterium]